MIKHVSINRFEGYGIIERIEGNGWNIDADHIELNDVNARIIEDLENRTISLNGPTVEGLFKSLRDLLKENGGLRGYVNDMERSIEEKDDRVKTLEKKLGDANIEIAKLNDKLEGYDSSETISNNQINYLMDKCDSLEKDLKEKEAIIEEKKARIRMLNNKLLDKNIKIDVLNNSLSNYHELSEKCSILENKLTIADKWNPIKDFIRETTGDDANFAIKTFLHLVPDYDVTISVSRKEEKDVEINKPEKRDSTKEILGWLRGMIENNTDYATKIFDKESKENVFSITFCKVPIEPEVVANEQG